MKNIAGTVVSIFVVFFMICITPLYYISVIQYARANSVVLSATRDIIDEVIDTRTLSEARIASYNLELASVSGYYEAQIIRKKRVLNPNDEGGVTPIYIVDDNIYEYNQGDRIVVKVTPIGDSPFQILTRTFLGIGLSNEEFQLAGRVR